MLLKFFQKSQIQVIVSIILLSLLVWIRIFINGVTYPFIFDSISMPLFTVVLKYLPAGILISKIVSYVVMMVMAFYILHINSKFIIIKQRSYLPALFFILISSAFIPVQRINPAIFAGFFVVLATDHLFSIYQKTNPLDSLFRAGISLGIASLIYAPAVVFYLILFIGLTILRSFNIKEWFVSLLGILLPWGFWILYLFWFDFEFSSIFKILSSNLITQTQSSIDEMIPIFFTAAISLPSLIAIIYMLPSMGNQKISVRKYQFILLWFIVLCIAAFIIIPTCSYEISYLVAIPLSLQLTNYFTSARSKFWTELFFILILLAATIVQVYPMG